MELLNVYTKIKSTFNFDFTLSGPQLKHINLPLEGSTRPRLTWRRLRSAWRAGAQRIYCPTEGRAHWQPAEQHNYWITESKPGSRSECRVCVCVCVCAEVHISDLCPLPVLHHDLDRLHRAFTPWTHETQWSDTLFRKFLNIFMSCTDVHLTSTPEEDFYL